MYICAFIGEDIYILVPYIDKEKSVLFVHMFIYEYNITEYIIKLKDYSPILHHFSPARRGSGA